MPDMEVPIEAAFDLMRLLQFTDVENVYVAQNVDNLVFRIGAETYIASKLRVDFPDIDGFLIEPTLANNRQMTCDREQLLSAVQRVSITADAESNAIKLTLEDNTLQIWSRDAIGNMSEESIVCDWKPSKGKLGCVVNHKFLADLLKSITDHTCYFFFGEDTASNKARVLCRDEEGVQLGIISQMRVNWAFD